MNETEPINPAAKSGTQVDSKAVEIMTGYKKNIEDQLAKAVEQRVKFVEGMRKLEAAIARLEGQRDLADSFVTRYVTPTPAPLTTSTT